MRTVLAVTATALLALTGCANGATEPPPAPTTGPAQSGPIELELGETANLTKSANGPRDVDVALTGITVAEHCHHGLNNWHDDYTHDGGFFIEVTGDVDVRESPTDFSIPQWAAADEDRTIIDVAPASECAYNPDIGVQTFNDLVLPGTKSNAVSEYWVHTLPSRWFLNDPAEDQAFSWPVPQAVQGSPDVEPASEAAPVETSLTAPATNDCLVGSYGQPQFRGTQCLDKTVSSCGDPATMESGTTFFTDGSAGWTQQCADVMYPQQVQMRERSQAAEPTVGDDISGPFEPAAPPSEEMMPGWHCDGPAYLCRDDKASGKTEGQQNWTP